MDDLSEKEQLDALRAWWAENGSFVMGGIAVGIIVIFGWNTWQRSIAETETAASALFEDVMEASARGFIDSAITPAETLFAEYPSSPYASQARLALARLYMDSGRDQDAADVLRPLAESGANDELSLVGRLRLARILLYQERPEAVITLVGGHGDTAFAARFNEALGDAHAALGQYEEAQAAYIAALNDNPQAPTVDATLIQLKINDLPDPNQVADVETDVADPPSEDPLPDATSDDEAETEAPENEDPETEDNENADATVEDAAESDEAPGS